MQQDKEKQYEENRITYVQEVIEKKIEKASLYSSDIKEEVVHIRKTFWDDVRVNMDNPEEAAETLASIKQQSEMLLEREQTHAFADKERKTLQYLKKSPYFGRVDFLETGEKKTDVIYIGIRSLMDEANEDFLIYDWRAPISSIYYDYSPGPASYETSEGTITGEMSVKRQFIIREGKLITMFDTGITIGDELLKEVLGTYATTNMKSIVSTIQKEQNQIIRNERTKYLLVQGTAGSGKTSVALQRVAYLLYRHLHTLTTKNIMLFSPNHLFSSYIGTVLPDLGEEELQQTTYSDYLNARLGNGFVIESPFEQMEYMLTQKSDANYEVKKANVRYKASMEGKMLIDHYVNHLNTSGFYFKNITFRDKKIVSSTEITSYFYTLDTTISIPNRIQLVKNWLLQKLRSFEKEEWKEDWVLDEMQYVEKEEHMQVYREAQRAAEKNEEINSYQTEERNLAKRIVKKQVHPIKKAIEQLKFIDIRKMYALLYRSDSFIKEELGVRAPENWRNICDYTLNELKRRRLSYEDATLFLYFTDKIEGSKVNTLIKHVFIDEAQDYSPAQFAVIKQLYPNSKMTILGDMNQSIFIHSYFAPTLLSDTLYEEATFERMNLFTSYRSTKEIIAFTKGILHDTNHIQAFNRSGVLPSWNVASTVSSLQNDIRKKVEVLREKTYHTIAIICKTLHEAKELFEEMNQHIVVQLMDTTSFSYTKGIVILPSYLAKGIEFDAVLIYNASKEMYEDEFERKLFYTACTRAMHELHVYSLQTITPFAKNIPKETYQLYLTEGTSC